MNCNFPVLMWEIGTDELQCIHTHACGSRFPIDQKPEVDAIYLVHSVFGEQSASYSSVLAQYRKNPTARKCDSICACEDCKSVRSEA